MGFKASIICASKSGNNILLTYVLRYPRFVHSELMTHRVFSRNSASSRAIPAKKLREQVLKDPVIPVWFGETQKGMQADKELKGWKLSFVKKIWLWSRYPMCFIHWIFEKLRLHKQLTNRIIEPWMWIEVIVSSTEWKNFFKLRYHKDAQPEFQTLARIMYVEYLRITDFLFPHESVMKQLCKGEWHLPFIKDEERKAHSLQELKIMSSARCARVSFFLLEDGTMSTYEKDRVTYMKLVGGDPIHSSPTEHPAQAMEDNNRYGNFVGFKQHRKELENESGGDYEIRV